MKLRKLWMLGIASLLGLSLVGCGSSSKLELKKETFIYEYGATISMDVKDYLVKDTDKKVLKEAELVLILTYLSPTEVGVYDATIKYKKETVKFKVEVKDTKKPEFVDFKKEIRVEQNAENVDFAKYYTAKDLDGSKTPREIPVTVKVDSSKVDLTKTGSYEIKVTAKDTHKNKVSKKATVVVVSAEEAQAGNVDRTVDGNKPVSQVTQQNNTNSGSSGAVTPPTGGTSGGNTNTGGGGSTPQPVDKGPIVQLTPTPLGGQLFDTQEQAWAWADSIFYSYEEGRKFAAQFGYTTVTNWTDWDIAFGYANTGEFVYKKYSIKFTFQ